MVSPGPRDQDHLTEPRAEVVMGLDPGEGDIPERSAYCDPIHITRIEPPDSIEQKRSPRWRK